MPPRELLKRHTEGLQIRDFETRAAMSDEGRTLTAIGVPYETEISLGFGYYEKFAPGSVRDDGAILRYAHKHPIGRIESTADTADGREIVGTISETSTGNDVATLIRDGVLTRMSIGFEGIRHEITERDDGTTLITWHEVRGREYSVVEFPAYETAEILDMRHRETPSIERKTPMPTIETTDYADILNDMQRSLDDMKRSIIELEQNNAAAPPPIDNRSAGTLIRAAIVNGDQSAIDVLNAAQAREWDGTKLSADALAAEPTFIKDLIRLIDNANPMMRHFSSSGLPDEGTTMEFVRLKTNTIKVGKQETEGTDLKTGKLDTQADRATIDTYGGYTTLSIQSIQRSPANILDAHLRGMAIAAGAALADDFNTFFEATVQEQESRALDLGKVIADVQWGDLNALLIDAAAAYTDMALRIDGLILDKKTFKALTSKTDKNGRPLFNVYGTGDNTIGVVNHNQDALTGDLAGLKLIPNLRATGTGMGENVVGTFYTSRALCSYTSPLARLQDANIINLTQAFSVYQYAAFADEIPTGLIPVKVTA